MLPNCLTLTKRATIYTACLLLILSKAQSTQQATPPTTPTSPQAHRVKIDSYKVLKSIVVDQYKSKKMSQDVYDTFSKILPSLFGPNGTPSFIHKMLGVTDFIDMCKQRATGTPIMYNLYLASRYPTSLRLCTLLGFLLSLFSCIAFCHYNNIAPSKQSGGITICICLAVTYLFYIIPGLCYWLMYKNNKTHRQVIENSPTIKPYVIVWHYLQTLDLVQEYQKNTERDDTWSEKSYIYSIYWTPSA